MTTTKRKWKSVRTDLTEAQVKEVAEALDNHLLWLYDSSEQATEHTKIAEWVNRITAAQETYEKVTGRKW